MIPTAISRLRKEAPLEFASLTLGYQANSDFLFLKIYLP